MTRFTTTHQAILDAARKWAESCLISDNSIFTDKSLWAPEILDEFSSLFTDNPNWDKKLNFTEKLEKQLQDGTIEVKQLAAELIWVLFLFPTRFSASKKSEAISQVWNWSGQDLPSPGSVEIAYEPGIGFPGTAFNTQRWREVNFLLSVVIEFKKLDHAQRSNLLTNHWDFVAWLDKIEDAENRQMRHILLHLLFPSHFERIATSSHKREIVATITSKEEVYAAKAPGSLSELAQLDWTLQAIRDHFSKKLERNNLDFYDPPLSTLWNWGQLAKPDLVEQYRSAIDAHSDLLWNRFRTVATGFEDFTNPGESFKERELKYKHKTLSQVADGITELEIGDNPDQEQSKALLALLKKANTNIVNFRSWDKTFGTKPDVTHRILEAIWKVAQDELSADNLFKIFKREGLTPTWDGLSFALWCLNPERFFPIKISFYRKLSDTLGVPFKKKTSPNEKQLSEIVSFATALRDFLSPQQPTDWTDVQSFWWVCSHVYAPPFDRLFPYGKADWILDDFSSVISALEKAPGFKKANLSVTLRNTSGSGAAIVINYGRWIIYSYRPRYKGGRYSIAVKSDGVFSKQVAGTEEFADQPHGETFHLLRQTVTEYEAISGDDWELILNDLPLVVDHFKDFKASPYLRHHREEIYRLIMSEDERAHILQEGIELGAENDDNLDDMTEENTPTHFPAYSRELALEELFLSDNQFDDILAMLETKKNIILQGPPGVGKTFIARRLAYALMEQKDESRAPMIQFHQSYSYEDFIQGYRPNDDAGFELRNGIFYDLCKTAQANPEQSYFLVIDEINRGNLSKIFGELLMLIEADKRDPSLALQLTHSTDPGDKFHVPPNIHLIGTMNTADRSLSVVDYALRRRFAFITLQSEFQSPKFSKFLTQRGVPKTLVRPMINALSSLNETIEKDKSLGNGFSIGHSFFCPPDGLSDFSDWFRKVVKFEVTPLLSEYWLDESEKVTTEAEALLQIIE